MFPENGTEMLVQPDAIGVDTQIQVAAASQPFAKGEDYRLQLCWPGQQRLAAVQHHGHPWHAMRLDVLGDSGRDLRGCRDVHDPGTAAPALVGVFVDVAVVTREITPAVYFEYKLADWHQSAHFALRSAIEKLRPEA
jgi:hypothetical protein